MECAASYSVVGRQMSQLRFLLVMIWTFFCHFLVYFEDFLQPCITCISKQWRHRQSSAPTKVKSMRPAVKVMRQLRENIKKVRLWGVHPPYSPHLVSSDFFTYSCIFASANLFLEAKDGNKEGSCTLHKSWIKEENVPETKTISWSIMGMCLLQTICRDS